MEVHQKMHSRFKNLVLVHHKTKARFTHQLVEMMCRLTHLGVSPKDTVNVYTPVNDPPVE